MHSGSYLLNELTNYGEFDLFGGNDLAAVHAGMSMLASGDSHLLPWLFLYYWVKTVTFSEVNLLCPMRLVTSNGQKDQSGIWNNCEAILEGDAKSPSKLDLKH